MIGVVGDDPSRLLFQKAARLQEEILVIGRNRRILEMKRAEHRDDRVGDSKPCEPLLVCRDNVPGSPARVCMIEGILIRFHVFRPMRPLLHIRR